MSWKKNVFSYLLWIVYTIVVGIGLLGVNNVLCAQMGYKAIYSYLLSGAYLLVAGLLVLLLYKITQRISDNKLEKAMVRLVIEGIAFIALLAGGIILRITAMQYVTGQSVDMAYFDAAKVVEGQTVQPMVHGATYFYVQLLHLIFLLVGNKLSAALWFQIILQLLTIMILYLSVRRLAGVLHGIITTGILMFSPYMISHALTLSPEWFFLLVFSITLLVLVGRMDKTDVSLWYCLAGGILIGVCCYLDLTGVLLLVFVAGVFSVMRDKPAKKLQNERGTVFLVYVLGASLGWLTAILVDTICCRKGFAAVVKAWSQLYQPEQFQIPVSIDTFTTDGIVNLVVVLGFMGMGIFSFWCRHRRERQGVWIGTAIVLALLQCFGMLTTHIDGSQYLYVFFVILAGVGFANSFAGHGAVVKSDAMDAVTKVIEGIAEKEAQEERQASGRTYEEEQTSEVVYEEEMVEEAAYEEEQSAEEVCEEQALGEHVYEEEQTSEVVYEEEMVEEAVSEVKQDKKVKFLDNPLPLPKKHVPKVMDYRVLDVASDADYDYYVADDDDFDI